MKEQLKTTVETNVKIVDNSTGEVLVDKSNAIHPGNMAIAIARGLSNSNHHQIFKLKLGNQGTYIDSSQQIVFRPPNTTGLTADLYQATYYEVVDSTSGGASGNSVVYGPVPATTSQRVIVTCVVSANEAVNRPSDDASSATPTPDPSTDAELDPEGQYFFDELGLFTQGNGSFFGPYLADEQDELMLSHLIFSPIEHTGSRELTITYSLIITVT